jgi:CRP-like cAMP-binding protein
VIVTNRVLNALSEEARQRVQPHLEFVRLPSGRILYEPGDVMRHAFFLEHGIVSLLAVTSDGTAAEVAMIGNDSMIGLPSGLPVNTAPYQVLVQLAGDAHRLPADLFRSEFRRDPSVQDAVLAHVHTLVRQLAQSGVCHRYHTARQRLCRWLLMTQDRARADTIPLTQEFLSHMLGASRKRVSHAAAQLQDAACIRQRHGQIKILDRRGLEQRACECYRVLTVPRSEVHAAPLRTPASASHASQLR